MLFWKCRATKNNQLSKTRRYTPGGAYSRRRSILLTKYNEKKPKNQDLAKMIDKHVNDKTAERIEDCNNFMTFIADCECVKGKQIGGSSCNNRLCPICMFRMSRKDALKIHVMMRYLEDVYGLVFVMASFTAPNVKGVNLKDEISRYGKAFKNLEKRKDVSTINKGYIRKLEVTYNSNETITHDMWHGLNGRPPMGEYFARKGLSIGDVNPNYDTYHTHYHVIFAVNKSYFKHKEYYIKHETWLTMWREAMNDNSITQVDIRRVKKNPNGKGGSASEIAKYVAKDSDYLINQEVFDVFYTALKGRQLITYNKLFKDANKKYKAGELDHYKTLDTTEYVNMLHYAWGGKTYNETERRQLTEEEKKEFNGHLVNEADMSDDQIKGCHEYEKKTNTNNERCNSDNQQQQYNGILRPNRLPCKNASNARIRYSQRPDISIRQIPSKPPP